MSMVVQGTDAYIKVPLDKYVSVDDLADIEVDVFQGNLVYTKNYNQVFYNESDGNLYVHLSEAETFKFSGTVLNVQTRYRLKGRSEIMGTQAYPVRMRPLWVKKRFGENTDEPIVTLRGETREFFIPVYGLDKGMYHMTGYYRLDPKSKVKKRDDFLDFIVFFDKGHRIVEYVVIRDYKTYLVKYVYDGASIVQKRKISLEGPEWEELEEMLGDENIDSLEDIEDDYDESEGLDESEDESEDDDDSSCNCHCSHKR